MKRYPMTKRNPSKKVGVARGHQRADTLKPHSQKTGQSNHTRTTALSNSMKLSHARGPPKTGGSWWRGLTECGPLEKGMANHFSILVLRIPWTVWKGKKNMTVKDKLPRLVDAPYATGERTDSLEKTLMLGKIEGRRRWGWQRMRWLDGITNSSSSSRWCHPTISSSVVPFSSCLQSFPASGSFPVNQFFPSGC